MRLSVSPTYDARGNLQSAGSSNWYIYTADNLLYSAWNQATLSYDPAGRMHQEAGASVTRMLWDGDTLIAEYDNGMEPVACAGGPWLSGGAAGPE